MSNDFQLRNEGSVCLLTPTSGPGREWVEEFLPADCPRFGRAYAIETNHIGPILEGIEGCGFAVGQV